MLTTTRRWAQVLLFLASFCFLLVLLRPALAQTIPADSPSITAASITALHCPPPPQGVEPGCRIVILNRAEELSLTGAGNVFDAALYAKRMELEATIAYWRKKIQEAPQGKIVEPSKP